MKSELQNAVDRLRQKLYDLKVHSQEKQNKYTIDKQQWEVHRLELSGKINEVRRNEFEIGAKDLSFDFSWKSNYPK